MHASVLRPWGVRKVNLLLQTALGCDLGFRVCLRSRDVVKALGAWPTFQAWPEPRLGKAPGEENGNPSQYFCLGNTMDRGAQWVKVHGTAKELDVTWQLNNTFLLISNML